MHSQKIHFPNSKGEHLVGVLETPTTSPRGWALFAHCFSCSKNTLAATRISRELAASGIGTLRFDFTGLGESEGAFDERGFSGNVDDLIQAVHWMAEQGRQVELLVGHSLGGAAIVVAAGQLPQIKAVATLGAPADADHVISQFSHKVPEIEAQGRAEVDLAGRAFVLQKAFLDDVKQARVRDAAANLKRPLLIMHSPTDQVVGIDNATALFVAAKHPKSFVSLDNADHLLTDAGEARAAAQVISAWAGRYLDAPKAASPSPTPQSHDVIVRSTGEAGPYQNEVLINGQRFLADEPTSVGGAGTGPDPYEWVSAGLGACTSMTLQMYADRKNWPLERVTVRIDHAKKHASDCVDCGPKDKVDVFSRQLLIEGELDEAQRARLVEIADRCPVHRTLESTAVIETTAVIE